MTTNSSWVPEDDPQTLFSERCWLQGAMISAVAYGVTVSLSFLSFSLLVRGRNHVEFKKRLPLLIYVTLSFILGTLFMCALAAFTQMAFIDDRNYPGGPSAFESNEFSIPVDDSGNIAFVLSNWLSDALLVWRFKVIFRSRRAPLWLVVLLPSLMFAGSVALGILFLIQVSTTNPYFTNGINFTLPYLSLSLALNIILTIAIVFRLLTFRYHIVSVLGPKFGSQYTSIAAMLIESAALYSAISITFLVLFGLGNPVSQVFLQSLNQFQTIATLLIVFRVAQGKGWNEDTATYVMSTRSRKTDPIELGRMRFASPSASLTWGGSGEMRESIASGEFQECLKQDSSDV